MDAREHLIDSQAKTMSPESDHVIGSFLAVAVGDALGWPFEDRAHRFRKHEEFELPEEFFGWTRKVGTRFLSFEEPVSPGAYSDDTQLTLATARSLLHADWWEHFTSVELPFWSVYESGGGGATKRAADSWLERRPPWRSPKLRAQYFLAGGNGVAMRILPHVVRHAETPSFAPVAQEIVRNALTTHGHPRALLGALLHGFALWVAFRDRETLAYGELIAAALADVGAWSDLLDSALPMDASEHFDPPTDYFLAWKNTVSELRDLLDIAQAAIDRGSLTTGPEVLEELGAFDRRINGAGTIAAAAAIFLASRFAAAPLQGILAAATMVGTDSDTIASMTGSLLGAIHGDEWLGRFATTVQDATYIRRLASLLRSRLSEIAIEVAVPSAVHPFTKQSAKHFRAKLERMNVDDTLPLPDGRLARVVECHTLPSRNADVRNWNLSTEDGQTLLVRRAKKRSATRAEAPARDALGLLKFGVRLSVADLAAARRFYVEQLGLPIERETTSGFTVNDAISIHETKTDANQPGLGMLGMSTILCLKVGNIASAYDHVRKRNIEVLGHIDARKGVRFFRVRDPSGNIIEIFEAKTPTS